MRIEPFRIDVPQADVDALRDRLGQTRRPPDDGGGWELGVDGPYLRELVEHWRTTFDWRAQEARINAIPQFRAVVDGVPVHFLHVRGNGPAPVPLILNHGWPWSFWDFKDVIGPLSDPAAHGGSAADAFDVVVPSLPGFTFSNPLPRHDIGYLETADQWVRLMRALGYRRFVTHGGDAGAFVSSRLGQSHPEAVLGVHLSFPVLPGMPPPEPGESVAPAKVVHAVLHADQPRTLAHAMHDSPVGQAAWLLQRRRDWSDCAGDVESVFDRETLLTQFSLYWFTDSFLSSEMFCHASNFGAPMPAAPDPTGDGGLELDVPTAIAVLPHDLLHRQRSMVARHCDLRQWTEFPAGGHFAAAEEPARIVQDIRSFVRPLRT